MQYPQIAVFADGTKDGGGSGFANLVMASRRGILEAKIAGVICCNENGGVRRHANTLGIPFMYLPGPYPTRKDSDERRLELQRGIDAASTLYVTGLEADFVVYSGLLKLVRGLNPRTTCNIHPGPFPHTRGMYGHRVHEEVFRLKLPYSAVTMHFVTDEYDAMEGVFFQYPVFVGDAQSADEVEGRVRAIEVAWQPYITNLVVSGAIKWDGKNRDSLRVPEGYTLHNTNLGA